MASKTLPFEVTEFIDVSVDTGMAGGFDHLLGSRYETEDGREFVLVKVGATCAGAKGKAFKWSDRSAYTVQLGTAETDICAGALDILHDATALAAGDYILLQRKGRCSLTHGDDHSSNGLAAAKPYALISGDTDTGKIEGVATASLTTEAPEVVLGIYVSGTAADNATMVVDLILN